MKIHVFVIAITIAFSAVSANAACRTELRENDSFRELSQIISCMNREIQTLKSEVENLKNKIGRKGVGKIPLIPPVGGSVLKIKGFVFSAQYCEKEDSSTKCTLTVTARKKDEKIIFGRDTYAYTKNGDRLQTGSVEISDRKIRNGNIIEIIQGIPAKVHMIFNESAQGSAHVTAIGFMFCKVVGYSKKCENLSLKSIPSR